MFFYAHPLIDSFEIAFETEVEEDMHRLAVSWALFLEKKEWLPVGRVGCKNCLGALFY